MSRPEGFSFDTLKEKFLVMRRLRLPRGDFGNERAGIVVVKAPASVHLRLPQKHWSVGIRNQRTLRSRTRFSSESIRWAVVLAAADTREFLCRAPALVPRQPQVERQYVDARRQHLERGRSRPLSRNYQFSPALTVREFSIPILSSSRRSCGRARACLRKSRRIFSYRGRAFPMLCEAGI